MSIGKWDLSGVHGLRRYIWQLLQDELGWSIDNYNVSVEGKTVQMVPIITPEQQPEMTSINAPFLVYSYAKKQGSNNYFLEQEVASFTVYSPNEKDIRQVINMLDAKFDKRDEAARELNGFIGSADLDPAYKDFDYKTLWVSGIQGPQPQNEEGGRRDGVVNINITYTHYGPNGLAVRN
jgi:hypothetical protein